jgi:hypothetical protein
MKFRVLREEAYGTKENQMAWINNTRYLEEKI